MHPFTYEINQIYDEFFYCAKYNTKNKFALKWTSKADQSFQTRRGENVRILYFCIQINREELNHMLHSL